MKVIFWWIIIIGVTFFSAVSNAATFLYFNSESGDYIGQGIDQTLTTDNGVFTAISENSSNMVAVNFDGTTWWNLKFAAPDGDILQTGPYENAARYPFQSPTQPGLDVSGDGRGCNELTGRFDILEISYTSQGEIDRFSADFEQHCEGADSALFGSIRYNATRGFPLKVDIKANGEHTPIFANVGEPVEISVTTDAGDDEGVLAEHWLGLSGTYWTSWLMKLSFLQRMLWMPSLRPKIWFYGPITTSQYKFDWTPKTPGVYMFQVSVDKQRDYKINTQFVDHIIITALSK